MDRYDVAVFLAEYIITHALSKHLRFAAVGNEPLIDPSRFGELVAVNRGVNIKVETNLERGLEWLNQYSANKPDARDGL